jgi:transcriptional regulator with XRE-family HTH domain
MKKEDVSQAELSVATNIGKSSISQYLSGKNIPKHKTINLLATALNVDDDWLAGITEDDDADPKEKELLLTSQKITVEQVARRMGVSKDFVRIGIQQGQLPFGVAVKMSSVYTYYINPKQFLEYIGDIANER